MSVPRGLWRASGALCVRLSVAATATPRGITGHGNTVLSVMSLSVKIRNHVAKR